MKQHLFNISCILRKLTEELEKLLRRDRSPLAENPFAKNESQMTQFERMCAHAPPLDSDVQRHLSNFSLITHGFGGPAMVAVLNAFKHYLNSMRMGYEKLDSKSSYSSSARNSATSCTSSSASTHSSINTTSNNNSGAGTAMTTASSTNSPSSTSSSSSSSSSNYFSSTATTNTTSRLHSLTNIELAALKVESKD